MKNKKFLLLMAIVVCALVAGYFIVKAIPSNDNTTGETTSTDTTEAAKPTIPLIEENYENVVKIRLINEYGDEIYFKNEEGTWVSDRDLTAYLNPEILNRMAIYGSSLFGITKVEDGENNLALFGLDNPAYTVTLTYNDDKTVTFNIGDKNLVTEEYYFMREGLEGVYTVTKAFPGYYNFGFEDIRMYEDIRIPTETPQLQEMAIGYGDQKWHIKRFDEGSVHDVSGVRAWFMLDLFEHETAIDTTNLEALQTWFTVLGLDICDIYKATAEQLETYGLADGKEKGYLYYRFADADDTNIEYEEKIWLGNKTEDGEYYYVKPDGRSGVYRMLAKNIDALLVYEEEDLLQKYISVINIDTIESYSIKSKDLSYEATVQKTGTNDAPVYRHYNNGKILDKAAAGSFYADLIGIYAEKGYVAKEDATGEEVLKITFNRNTEIMPVYEVTFYEYSVSYYTVAVNGQVSYLINARDFKSLQETITAFVANIPYSNE
ncbi:MAG: DUF4340 domain-containing protein [Lachnospiraceae bacterium]|nr:DUF4340 domain-containing protein [Lachnospiraceae bacterium]